MVYDPCPSSPETTTSGSTSANISETSSRPTRKAATEGTAARKATDASNRALDRTIASGMGNANPVFTNAGTVRQEYLGVTSGFQNR